MSQTDAEFEDFLAISLRRILQWRRKRYISTSLPASSSKGAVNRRDASIHLFIYMMLLTVGNLWKDDPFARRNPRQ
jgi:hypothetical protein